MGIPLRDVFAADKPIVAMVHLPALPGRPRQRRALPVAAMIDGVLADLSALQDAGVDGLLFCNEADLPYQLEVGPEVPAAMAAIIGRVHSSIRVPFGVDIVWDPYASLAVARATGAAFIREVVTGVAESDHGLMQPRFGDVAGYRERVAAGGVAIFGNITPEFGSSLGRRTVADRARSAVFLGLDVILVSGQITGTPLDIDELRAAKAAAGETPVLANTGVRAETVADILAIADGALVGTSLKVDGITWNPVDRDRAARFMAATRQARQLTGVA